MPLQRFGPCWWHKSDNSPCVTRVTMERTLRTNGGWWVHWGGKHRETRIPFWKKCATHRNLMNVRHMKLWPWKARGWPASECLNQCVWHWLIDWTAGIHCAAAGSRDFWLRWPCVTRLFVLPFNYAVSRFDSITQSLLRVGNKPADRYCCHCFIHATSYWLHL